MPLYVECIFVRFTRAGFQEATVVTKVGAASPLALATRVCFARVNGDTPPIPVFSLLGVGAPVLGPIVSYVLLVKGSDDLAWHPGLQPRVRAHLTHLARYTPQRLPMSYSFSLLELRRLLEAFLPDLKRLDRSNFKHHAHASNIVQPAGTRAHAGNPTKLFVLNPQGECPGMIIRHEKPNARGRPCPQKAGGHRGVPTA